MANDSNPFAPAVPHAVAIEATRVRARADATRHAEDLLERPLPVVQEAEQLARQRIALLDAARAERLGELTRRVESTRRDVDSAEQRRAAVLDALAAAGVRQEELDLPPLDASAQAGWRVLAPLVALVLGAGAGFALRVDAATAVIAGAVLAAVAYATTSTAEEPAAEPLRLRKLRHARAEAETELLAAWHAHAVATEQLETFHIWVRALARAERAHAEQIVATYVTDLTSAMPPGALADGRGVGHQVPPRVDLPDWARETP
jgi:hypothetical protein